MHCASLGRRAGDQIKAAVASKPCLAVVALELTDYRGRQASNAIARDACSYPMGCRHNRSFLARDGFTHVVPPCTRSTLQSSCQPSPAQARGSRLIVAALRLTSPYSLRSTTVHFRGQDQPDMCGGDSISIGYGLGLGQYQLPVETPRSRALPNVRRMILFGVELSCHSLLRLPPTADGREPR